jgi:protein involved in polysaccharide export with SLBB domain
MKKTFCILLTLIMALAATGAFCAEKAGTGWGAETIVDSYQIGVGDILEITTWKEPDFSRENVLVRSDGKISFPLINDFPAAGLSPMELKFNLEKALKAYVGNPVVTVTVTNPASQKFYILGEVMRTGSILW